MATQQTTAISYSTGNKAATPLRQILTQTRFELLLTLRRGKIFS